MNNGLLDRFLLVHPKNAKAPLWGEYDSNRELVDTAGIWDGILRNLIELDFNPDSPTVLEMTPDARECLGQWHDTYTKIINSIEDDEEIDTRNMKHDYMVARFALVLQLLHWACGEATGDRVELSSAEGALKLIDYYEDCYSRLRKNFGAVKLSVNRQRLLSLLPERFSTKDAIEVGKKINFGEHGVKHALGDMVKIGVLEQPSRGEYVKVKA